MSVNQLKAGAALSYISIILNNIVGITYTPFMLRMMGQNEYGLYSLVSSIVAYLTVLDLGFGAAITRYTAKFRAENKIHEQYQMFGMFLILYSVIGVIAFIIGLGLYFNVENLFDSTMTQSDFYKVRIMLLLMIFNIAFTFPMSIWGAIITAYEDFVFQKLINIARIVLNPLVMVVLLCLGYKAIAMVVVITCFNVVTLAINAWYCWKKLKIKVEFGYFNWLFLKEIGIYSFWIFLASIVNQIYWSSGQFILGMFSGPKAVAIYAVAIQLSNIFTGFSTAVSSVFLPKVTAMVTKNDDYKQVSDLFIRTGRIQYIIIAFILVGFILFGKQFILLWAGKNYEGAYSIALLFFIPLTVPLIQNLGIVILEARNKMKFRSILYLIISLSSLFLSVPLSKYYGGFGCAIGTSISLIMGQILVMNIYYNTQVHIDILKFWKEILSMSVFPFLVGLVAWIILQFLCLDTPLLLVTGIICFTVIYVPIIWRTSLNESERQLFYVPLSRIYNKVFLRK